MSRRLLRRNSDGTRLPDLVALTGDSGIDNLDPYLTINSQKVAPTFVYRGADATATNWPGYWGDDLAIDGSGTAPSLNQPALGNGENDYAVKFNNGKYYDASDTSFADVDAEDFVIEIVGYWSGTAVSKRLINKSVAGSPLWQVTLLSTGAIYLYINDGITLKAINGGSISPGCFFHSIFFVDRSGSAVGYLNKTAGTPLSISTIGSLSNSNPLAIGARSDGSDLSDSGIVHAAMWMQSSWLDTHLQATVAAERFYKWSGIWPAVTTGTATPNAYTRASSAYAQKWNGTSYDLINCCSGLPRVDYVRDLNNRDFRGILIEPQATNLFTYSEDSTQWTLLDAGDSFGASAGIAPNGESVMVSLTADSTDGQHGGIESNAPTLTASSYTYSRFFIAGNNRYAWLEDTTVANTQSWFDLQNGTVGTEGSAATGSISGPYYSDIGSVYRCSITFTGTAAAHDFNWGSASADNDETFAGDGSTINCYTWGAQIELGTKWTSTIDTAGASVTRSADSLQYNGDNVTAGTGTCSAATLMDAHTPGAELSIVHVSDGGSATEAIRGYVDTGTVVPIFSGVDSGAGQWTITGATDVVDGGRHIVRGTWDTDNAKQFVDRTLDGTPDTSCTVPTGIDEIDVGQDVSGSNQLNGRIRNLQIWGWDEENLG